MKNKVAFLAMVLAGIIMPVALLSQEGEVFAPYPSRLRVGTKEDEIILTWEDSPDIKAGYAVYRSKSLPTPDNFAEAELLSYVNPGIFRFSYKTEDKSKYYYFVLGRIPAQEDTENLSVYKLFIPMRNMTLNSIAPSADVSRVIQPGLPLVSGILTSVSGEAISISVEAKGDTGRLVLYRSTKPITGASSLLDAVLTAIMEPGSGPYKDYPVPGIDYYYAVLAEKDLSSGVIKLVADQNATSRAISIQAGIYRIGLPSSGIASRSMPLPYLMLSRSFVDAQAVDIMDPLVKNIKLSAETEKSIQNLIAKYASNAKQYKPKIIIFPEDLKIGSGGEEYVLASIISEHFAKGAYAEAAKQLNLFLSLPRSQSSVDKAHFYKGQALALSGLYREAFFDLLQSQKSYYTETADWIDYILEQLRQIN
ncbi:hypothetical protein MASR2M29_22360 [Spirochaetota bacterium]